MVSHQLPTISNETTSKKLFGQLQAFCWQKLINIIFLCNPRKGLISSEYMPLICNHVFV